MSKSILFSKKKVFLHAFTLIEVLVVVAIMGIIMGVGSLRFRDFERRQKIVSIKRQMLADIRAAQSDALSGRKPSGCGANLTLDGYAFRANSGSSSSYEIYAICRSSAGVQQDVTIKNVSLPTGVSLSSSTSSPPNVNPVIFYSVARGTNLSTNQSVTVSIASTGGANESVVIRASGEIK